MKNDKLKLKIIFLTMIFFGLFGMVKNLLADDEGLLGSLWNGTAHFQQIGTLQWNISPYNSPHEGAGWTAVVNGKWYLFDRLNLLPKPDYCPGTGYWGVVVRESDDQGITWSNPAETVIMPDSGRSNDMCGIVDGSSYYDSDTDTWHMIAQCLAENNVGGWGLCHYTRAGSSPMGSFTPDINNPVVYGGDLWSRICTDSPGTCSATKTINEGTPDIIMKKNGYYYVTFHGWNSTDVLSYRGVAKTTDFDTWIVDGGDMPGDAIMNSTQCQAWNLNCIGPGEATTMITGDYQYMLIETPDTSLVRIAGVGQYWPFALVRANKDEFLSWSGAWESFSGNPIIKPVCKVPGQTPCLDYSVLNYARWFVDSGNVYLIYGDSEAGPGVRRLLKLLPGGGPPIDTSPPAAPSGLSVE